MMQPRTHARSLAVLILLLVGTVWTTPVTAQTEDTGVTLSVDAGFDSFYKNVYWTPVQINVANSGPTIDGQLRVLVGGGGLGQQTVYTSSISLPTQSDKRVTLYVNIPRATTPTVQLLSDNGRLVAEQSLDNLSQLSADALLYGVVSPEPGEFSFLETVSGPFGGANVAFLELDDLPATAVAWYALDVLVLDDVDTGRLTADQRAGLEAWIDTGGQLVVTGGPGWQQTVTPLADLLPVTVSGSETVDDLPQLSQAVGQPFRDPGPYLLTISSLRSGEMLYRTDERPILAYQSRGRGGVFFLALDPKLAPLLDWDGSEVVWNAVATRVPITPPWGLTMQNAYAAETAVSSLPDLSLPSVWQFILFLLIYVVVIGPVNYWILKRRRQLERAWLTIPVIIIIFTGIAYVTGFQLRGNDVLINQMSVAYSRADGEQARVQSLLGLYSPSRTVYDLVLPLDALAHPLQESFGGVESGSNVEAISFGNDVTLQGIRVDISAVETFMAQTVQPALAVDGQAMLESDGTDLLLSATVQNNSDRPLQNVTLLLGDTAVSVGDLGPGDSRTVSQPVGLLGSGSSTTLAPGAPRPFGGSGSSPLSRHADLILGGTDYFNDAELYPRWQLLLALENNSGGPGGGFGAVPNDVVTLTAWTDDTQVDTRLAEGDFETAGATLHLVELPLSQSFATGNQITIPVSLLEWSVLSQENVFSSSVQDLPLNGGTIAFEYLPWPEFQGMEVTDLAVALETPDTAEPAPLVELWSWEEEGWVQLQDADWGETAVANPTPFIGPDNAVRLRLTDQTQFGVYVNSVHPVITGDLP